MDPPPRARSARRGPLGSQDLGPRARPLSRALRIWRRAGETDLERRVRLALEALRLPYVAQARLGRYTVDFLVAGRLVVEADGRLWHPDPERARQPWALKKARQQRLRDAWLLAQGYRVLHLPEAAIRAGAHHARIRAACEELGLWPRSSAS